MLLDTLPSTGAGTRVLDFGCGTGIIGATVLLRNPGTQVELLDSDILSLIAAWENVPEASLSLGSGLAAAEGGPYDLIVSNPPFHEGKSEDLEVIHELITDAPDYLTKKGSLLMVVQRRLPLQRPLEAAFTRAEIVTEDATYRVWQAWRR
jgi:16S rRNA (guanine1207-N2)-methyltransferase